MNNLPLEKILEVFKEPIKDSWGPKVLDNFFKIQEEMDKEFKFLLKNLEEREDTHKSPFFLRLYYRSLWVCMEATLNSLKEVISVFSKNRLSLDENQILHLLNLKKEKKDRKETGIVIENRSKPFENNFKETIKLFSKILNEYGLEIDVPDLDNKLVEKRNMLTHPKNPKSLEITLQEFLLAYEFIEEVRNKIFDSVSALMNKFSEYIREK